MKLRNTTDVILKGSSPTFHSLHPLLLWLIALIEIPQSKSSLSSGILFGKCVSVLVVFITIYCNHSSASAPASASASASPSSLHKSRYSTNRLLKACRTLPGNVAAASPLESCRVIYGIPLVAIATNPISPNPIHHRATHISNVRQVCAHLSRRNKYLNQLQNDAIRRCTIFVCW